VRKEEAKESALLGAGGGSKGLPRKGFPETLKRAPFVADHGDVRTSGRRTLVYGEAVDPLVLDVAFEMPDFGQCACGVKAKKQR